jgi:hypothetical protein
VFYTAIITACPECQTKRVLANAFCEQNVEFLNVKPAGASSCYRETFEGKYEYITAELLSSLLRHKCL